MATWELTYARSPSAVKFDGTALTEYASLALAQTAGRGWVDAVSSAGKLYLVLDGGDTPWSGTVFAILPFYFSTKAKVFNNQFYEPRVGALPALSSRIEDDFTGITQIGGGSVSLDNADGFFNGLPGIEWAAGDTTIKMGCDTLHSTMAYADYETVATFENDSTDYTDNAFKIRLVDRRNNLKRNLPADVYDRDTYPFILDKWVGKPIPLAYGQIYGAPAACINTVSEIFKLCSHAIYSLGTVQYFDSSTQSWTNATVTADLPNGQFTFADWDGKSEVKADFVGMKDDDGQPLTNPAGVVEDLLSQVGETSIDTASFTTATAEYRVGTNYQTGRNVESKPVALYVATRAPALNWIGKVNAFANGYLSLSETGQYSYKAFVPQAGAGLDKYTTADILSFAVAKDPGQIISAVQAYYGERIAEKWSEVSERTSISNRYGLNETTAETLSIDLPTASENAANEWGDEQLVYRGQALRLYDVSLPWKSTLLSPGEQIHIVYDEDGHDIDGVFEVIERNANLLGGSVDLLVGNLRNIVTCGFWTASSPTFPAELGGAAVTVWNPNWTEAQKRWAKQNVFFWTDANGFADATDPDSYLGSRWV